MSEERKVLLRMYGAELIEVAEGDFDAAIFLKIKWLKVKATLHLINLRIH